MNTKDEIGRLHASYVRATGINLPLTMDREQAWYWWLQKRFTPQDVTDLVRHHQRLAKMGKPARSLAFRSLVLNVDWAEEDLAMLRAQRRVPPPQPNRESILRQTGRGPADGMAPEQIPAKRASKEEIDAMIAKLKEAAK